MFIITAKKGVKDKFRPVYNDYNMFYLLEINEDYGAKHYHLKKTAQEKINEFKKQPELKGYKFKIKNLEKKTSISKKNKKYYTSEKEPIGMYLGVENGKFVIVEDWELNWDEPTYYRFILDTGIKVNNINNTALNKPVIRRDKAFYIFNKFQHDGRGQFIMNDIYDGKGIIKGVKKEIKPFKKPRATKNYDWIYKYGKWKKNY